ncbi:MAG: uroporphyrinogen-III synthase [Arthrobacter sp.]|uniref:uroporphyrinogen-III synthase n=1 Tax=Arthrobacter sp. TaxID=1667 RepID=UPI00346D962B
MVATAAGAALAGRTAAVLRAPDRAAGIVAELAARGASAVVCPLIDFELPADTGELDESLRLLLQGHFAWMALTSVTTVRALAQRCAALGRNLAVPDVTRVAVVGEATRRAAEQNGLRVDLIPEAEQSAAGMVARWPLPGTPGAGVPGTVFLPQADLAADTLNAGLLARGWQTAPVVAYRTVDAPADPDRRIAVPATRPPAAAETVEPAELAALLGGSGTGTGVGSGTGAGTGSAAATRRPPLHAVFLTSPSIARRVRGLTASLPSGVALIAIGRPTAAEAARLGLPVAATAADPSPSGLCDAWERVLATAGGVAPAPTFPVPAFPAAPSPAGADAGPFPPPAATHPAPIPKEPT